jgi:hypothetical protein
LAKLAEEPGRSGVDGRNQDDRDALHMSRIVGGVSPTFTLTPICALSALLVCAIKLHLMANGRIVMVSVTPQRRDNAMILLDCVSVSAAAQYDRQVASNSARQTAPIVGSAIAKRGWPCSAAAGLNAIHHSVRLVRPLR